MNKDTIASISTAPGESGIGIIRISGPEAISVCDRIYINPSGKHSFSSYPSHTIHYGYIVNSNEEIIDEVMVSVMKAPNSYTREDVVEINCHGGTRICRNILERVLETGARPADPGEFTKRAFLNGRLDLTRAEAVMDVIRATSDAALDQSVEQLRGSLYNLLDNICSDILYEIAHIEAALDDPDSISLDGYDEQLKDRINDISSEIEKLIRSYDEGRILSEGIRTIILGNPNAGKSSLLNLLLGEDRAIVTNIPGTTRDTLTETLRIDDMTLVLTDTAGIRETTDIIEQIGVNRAKQNAGDADLIIYIMDPTDDMDISDPDMIDLLQNKKSIFLINKTDIIEPGPDEISGISRKLSDKGISPCDIITTSMTTGDGIPELKQTIKNLFYKDILNGDHQVMITNLRHVYLLKRCLESLNRVRDSINAGVSEDLYCIDLTDSYRSLAQITGADVSEDIVNEIFSKFCMGK